MRQDIFPPQSPELPLSLYSLTSPITASFSHSIIMHTGTMKSSDRLWAMHVHCNGVSAKCVAGLMAEELKRPILYGFWLSPYTSLVANILVEAEIDYGFTRVSTLSRENQADSYLEVSRYGKVPTLVDVDGTAVSESSAICRCLARRHPQVRDIYPTDNPKACASVDAISDFLSFHIIGPYFNWFVVSGHFPIAWGLRTNSESRIYGQWSRFLVQGELERLLSRERLSPYFCGSQPTLPDFQLFYMLEHGRVLADLYRLPELDLRDSNATLETFYWDMTSRASTAEILGRRANFFATDARELLTEMKPAHEDMLTSARLALAEMFGHQV